MNVFPNVFPNSAAKLTFFPKLAVWLQNWGRHWGRHSFGPCFTEKNGEDIVFLKEYQFKIDILLKNDVFPESENWKTVSNRLPVSGRHKLWSRLGGKNGKSYGIERLSETMPSPCQTQKRAETHAVPIGFPNCAAKPFQLGECVS